MFNWALNTAMLMIKKYKSSHQTCSMKKGVLRNFAKFKGKYLCQSLFFDKVAGLSHAALLKKRPWHRCFPVNFAKFLRTSFLQNTSGRLLLEIIRENFFFRMVQFYFQKRYIDYIDCILSKTFRNPAFCIKRTAIILKNLEF